MLENSYGLRYRLTTHWSYFTCKISVNLFESGSDIGVEAEAVCKYTASTSLIAASQHRSKKFSPTIQPDSSRTAVLCK